MVEWISGKSGTLETRLCPPDRQQATNARCATALDGGALILPEMMERLMIFCMSFSSQAGFLSVVRGKIAKSIWAPFYPL
jgi:hypothetical protein